MSTAYLTEYARLPRDTDNDNIQAPPPAIASQKITYTTSTQSAAFKEDTRFVRIDIEDSSVGWAHVLFGENPTATASHQRFFHRDPEVRGVNGGEKAAFYDGSS